MLRTALTGGPAYLTWNGLTIQLHEDWEINVEENLEERKTNLQGLVGHGMNYRTAKISGKPVAVSTNLADLLTKLHPYKASDKGKRLSTVLGAADLPAVVQTADGRSVTFPAALLTKMPDITFAPNKDVIGEFELTALLSDGGDLGTLANFMAEASSSYTEPTLNPANLVSHRYTLSWGSTSPFNAIEMDESGLVLAANLQTADVMTQRDGLLDYRIEDVTAEAKFVPVNVSSAAFTSLVLAVQRGGMVGAAGLELTCQQITGTGGPKLVAQMAVPVTKPLRFGNESRVGEVTMRLERKFATTLQERYALSVLTT